MTVDNAEYPGWRVWVSRPRGLLWATRTGNVHYNDQPRLPGWVITVGPADDARALHVLLTEQARLDGDWEQTADAR